MKKVLYIAFALILALGLVIPLAGCSAGPGSNVASGGQVVALDVADGPAPTIVTDKFDYYWGDTVTITGSGFQADETVDIQAVGDVNGNELKADAVADGNGAFTATVEIPLADENDDYLTTATGTTSGLAAQTLFDPKKPPEDPPQDPPPMPGAIWTTDSSCTGVNVNIYDSKEAVYLNGGPPNPQQNGLPDGYYYVQVTEPDGALLGSTSTASVQVTNGEFTQCYQLSAILTKASNGTPGYDDTTNPGGEYKVWVSQDPAFDPNASKTDNFKVVAVTPPITISSSVRTENYKGNGELILVTDPPQEIPLGSKVYDKAIVDVTVEGGTLELTPAGTVDFALYKAVGEIDTPQNGETDDAINYTENGVALDANWEAKTDADLLGQLHAGTYYWTASYSGDVAQEIPGAESSIEPFTVKKGTVRIDTTPLLPAESPIPLASIVKDRATVTGSCPSFVPTGTVDFELYKGVSPDTTDPKDSQTEVSLVSGVADTPNYSPALHAGDYYYLAGNYSGDDDYEPYAGDSGPEPFKVRKADVTIVTVIYTKSGAIVTGEYPIASTTIVYDKATVIGIGVPDFEPAGTVAFTCNSNPAGSSSISGTDPVTVQSNDVGPLTAGNYIFKASYTDSSGDYKNKISADEPFSVVKVAKGTEGSKGLWTNKNGQAMLTLSDAAALNGEAPFQRVTPPTYPKETAGCTPFNTLVLNTFKNQVLNFLKPANAVDMRYMLAAQLLAAKLDYRHNFWPSDTIWIDANGDGIVQPGERFLVTALFTAADDAWSGTTRASQEYYKNMMEGLALAKYWFICP